MRRITRAAILDHGEHPVDETCDAMRDSITIARMASTSWCVTRAGQIVRIDRRDRIEVLDPSRARGDLEGLIGEDAIGRLFPAWTSEDESTASRYGWNLALDDHCALRIVPEPTIVSTYEGAHGAERAAKRIEEASRRPWHVSSQEAAICMKAVAAIGAGSVPLGTS